MITALTLCSQFSSSPPVWCPTCTECSPRTATIMTASTRPPTRWARSSWTTSTAGLTSPSSAAPTATRGRLPPSRTCYVVRSLLWRSSPASPSSPLDLARHVSSDTCLTWPRGTSSCWTGHTTWQATEDGTTCTTLYLGEMQITYFEMNF